MVKNQEPEGDQPRDGKQRDKPSQNLPANSVREDPTEHADNEKTYEKWGNLPEYMRSLKTRGGRPEVPEKYRKFHDAFLKESQKAKK